ncbi:o-succinylbenzoate synthase [Echinicola sediminis]
MNKIKLNTVRVQGRVVKHRLDFKFDAGTSRGVLRSKDSFFVGLRIQGDESAEGLGEAGPLPKLSLDDIPDFESVLEDYLDRLRLEEIPWSEVDILNFCSTFVADSHPSVRFALETALLDLYYGGNRMILENDFYSSKEAIPINGLIWMGEADFMSRQIEEKLAAGFTCIKMKIGAIDFEQEIRLLEKIRERFTADEITLRVDANGAFSPEEALVKLKRLAELELHSIEQPIKAGQVEEMAKLCEESPLDIALDEELIGVGSLERRGQLLRTIAPAYIILKPTLVGGIRDTKEWISLAEELGIGWWMTSALESNIGLNAIAQLTSLYATKLPQGLGTGQLYHNNISSPLEINSGKITYDPQKAWGRI